MKKQKDNLALFALRLIVPWFLVGLLTLNTPLQKNMIWQTCYGISGLFIMLCIIFVFFIKEEYVQEYIQQLQKNLTRL